MKPTPIFVGDVYGSTVSIMLYPDDLAKAKNWHAKHLASGALQAYREAGHSFEDRWEAFLQAIGSADVSNKETQARLAGASLAADAIKALWAMVCMEDRDASWNKAINLVCAASGRGRAGSPSHIRAQLRLFAPVLHLWLAWRLSDKACPPAGELFLEGYSILFDLRRWEEARPAAFRRSDGYLAADEYGPWPELAQLMASLGGHHQHRISLSQGLQRDL